MPQISAGDVGAWMQKFGYTPTDAEKQMFAGMDTKYAGQYISDYANFMESEQKRQANDPLTAYQDFATKAYTDMTSRADNLYKQAEGVLSSAPQLFGNMTSDQISTYLAPLQTAFQAASATTEGAMARRGMAGSNVEASALGDQQKQFQQNVLSQGLSIGTQLQQAKASLLQTQGNALYGTGMQAFGAAGTAAGQKSSQDLNQSNLLASMPYFLQSSATQQDASIAASRKKSSPWGAVGTVVGGVAGGVVGGPAGAMAGASLGGAVGNMAGGNNDAASYGGAGGTTGLAALLMANKGQGNTWGSGSTAGPSGLLQAPSGATITDNGWSFD